MALWVMVDHIAGNTGTPFIPVLRSPTYAVDGFMILSGFLMTLHYTLREEREPWTHPHTWVKFYVRRLFRICPLYYALLAPSYLFFDSLNGWRAVLHHAYQPSLRIPAVPPAGLESIALHLSFLFGLLPKYHSSLILPDWSLSLEMQFYLAFPFLMLFALRFGWPVFSLVSAAVWLLATRSSFAQAFVHPSPLPLSLLWFVIGMVWASAYIGIQKGKRGSVLLAALGASLSLISRDAHAVILVALFGWILFVEGKMAGGRFAGYVRQLLSGRVGQFLGDASYSVYLVHLLVVVPVAYFLCVHTHFNPEVRFAIVFAATAAISYGLAMPLAVIEKLGISWGKRLSAGIGRRNPSLVCSPDVPLEIPVETGPVR